MYRSIVTILFLAATLAHAGCSGDSPAAAGTSAASQPTVVRVSAIPDFNKATVDAAATALCSYLQQQVGVEFRWEPSSDYVATVNGLVANKLDLVWYGGLTAVDAQDEAKGQAAFLACRDIDMKFKSYFIANKEAIAKGKVHKVDDLAALKPMLKDLTFTFGDKKSTSGHLMPRYFLTSAGIAPETDFKVPAGYRLKGSHSATLQAVVSGEVDLGALNYSYYDKASPADRDAAPIVFTTPEYVDYCWVGHSRLGQGLLDKIRAALLALDPAKPEQQTILGAWSAGKFVAADAARWDGIRRVKNGLPKDFLK